MGGRIRVLICGSSTRLSAISSGAIRVLCPHISSVWRFGRNCRHLTKRQRRGAYAFTNLRQRRRISFDLGRSAQKYFTLVAKNVPTYGPFTMVLSFCTVCPCSAQPTRWGISRRSQTHGSNRNRIALHVALNGRRKSTR